MYAITYAPLALTWMAILFSDSADLRKAIGWTVAHAGLGVYSLVWVGYFTFLMQARSGGSVLKNSENTLFVIIYGAGNVVLELLHWFISPAIYDWLENAPLPPVVVEEPTPEEGEEGEEGEEEGEEEE